MNHTTQRLGLVFFVSLKIYEATPRKEMIIIDFVSKLINLEFPVIEKPNYLRSIFHKHTPEKTEAIIRGFKQGVMCTVKKEYFVNNVQTLISCSVDIRKREFYDLNFIDDIANYFYKPFFPHDEAPIEYKELSLESNYFVLFQKTGKSMNIKFDEQHFEIIPSEDEIIINFLIDNSALTKKIINFKAI